MPSGITHARSSLALAVGGGLLAFYQFDQSLLHSAALAGGSLLGILITPDLDVNEGCISREVVRRLAGPVLSAVWFAFWRPYSLVMPHRSPLSHFPVLGTAVRLLYLSILPALVFWFSGGGVGALRFPEWGWWVVGGLALSDLLHFLMDQIF